MEKHEAAGSGSGLTPPKPTRYEDEERELASTTDPKRRRQIQNRIAQRVYRQKQKRRLQDLESQACSKKRTAPDPDPRAAAAAPALTDEQADEYASWTPLAMTYPFANAITQRISPAAEPTAATATATSPPPPPPQRSSSSSAGQRALGLHEVAREELCIAVTSAPVRRAVLGNLAVLGIAIEHYALDDAASPFTDADADDAMERLRRARPQLAPTRLQTQVQHHPYVDVLPFAGFRDNILLALEAEALDEAALCGDIERYFRVWSGGGGARVWDARSFEVAPEFVEKWMWLLDGEVLEASNFWRGLRGEVLFEVEGKGRGVGVGVGVEEDVE